MFHYRHVDTGHVRIYEQPNSVMAQSPKYELLDEEELDELEDEGSEDEGSEESPTEPPARADNKDAWIAYATTHGYDASADLTKDQLIEQYGS